MKLGHKFEFKYNSLFQMKYGFSISAILFAPSYEYMLEGDPADKKTIELMIKYGKADAYKAFEHYGPVTIVERYNHRKLEETDKIIYTLRPIRIFVTFTVDYSSHGIIMTFIDEEEE